MSLDSFHDLTTLPRELTTGSRYVLWRYGSRSATGKRSKLPFQSNGSIAKVSVPETWCEFGSVIDAYQSSPDKFEGIGIVFTDKNRLVGIDIDGCRDPVSGVVDPVAIALIEQFSSYTEISPSGTGVHILVYGDMTGLDGHRSTFQGIGIEMYDRGRYFTLTGNELEGTPSEVFERQQELISVHSKVIKGASTNCRIRPDGAFPELDAIAPSQVHDLIDRNNRLSQLWRRSKPAFGQKDLTASGWCFWLANELAVEDVALEDITRALIEYRRIHGDHAKSLAWYETESTRAIQRAREISDPTGKPIGLATLSVAEQMSLLAMDEAIRHGRMLRSSTLRILLVELARFSRDGRTAYPSQDRLAKILGWGSGWVSRKISSLKELGCIEVSRKPAPGRNTEYRLIFDDSTHHRLHDRTTDDV